MYLRWSTYTLTSLLAHFMTKQGVVHLVRDFGAENIQIIVLQAKELFKYYVI